MRDASRGSRRSVDRGACRPANSRASTSLAGRHSELVSLFRGSIKSKHDCDLARRPERQLLPSSSDELSVGAAHSLSYASGNTLAPAGITHRLYFQGRAAREWRTSIKIVNVTSSHRPIA